MASPLDLEFPRDPRRARTDSDDDNAEETIMAKPKKEWDPLGIGELEQLFGGDDAGGSDEEQLQDDVADAADEDEDEDEEPAPKPKPKAKPKKAKPKPEPKADPKPEPKAEDKDEDEDDKADDKGEAK